MRILIVDDRPLGARRLRDSILASEPDYQVELAVTDGVVAAADRATQAVRNASERFDVFLIDDNLGPGPNGAELMTELRQHTPGCEAIIFTAYGDVAGKQRAIEAGARAYVTRPINERELLWQLRGIQRDVSTRRERDWLQRLAATTTKELQGAVTIQDAGRAIVQDVQLLGFQRARLRMVCGGQGAELQLIGVSQTGSTGLNDFTTTRRPLKDLPYSKKVLVDTRKPTLFHGRELGRAAWDEYVTPPKGDWFKVPLFVGTEPIGTLSLDNGADPCKYGPEEQQQLEALLDLFGNQAAAALERANRQARAEQEAESQSLLNQVSFAVTEQAAQGNLRTLLDALRRQINERLQFCPDSLTVALLDQGNPASRFLDCCYQFERGQVQAGRRWCSFADDPDKAWIARMVRDGQPGEDPTLHLTGIPLKVQEAVIGALLIQAKEGRLPLDETIGRKLAAIATHVAGLIQAVYREEREKEQHQRKDLCEKLIERLPQLARTDENHFWHAVLTFASHREGYSFNRAVLFRYGAERNVVQGSMGIGHFDRKSWQRDVEADDAAGEAKSFAAYLASSSVGQLHNTPLATAALNWCWRLSANNADPFLRLFEQAQPAMVAAAELRTFLAAPGYIFEGMHPAAQCALVPWKDGAKVAGVLLVDNAMDDKPVRQEDLEALERLLAQATRILNDAGEEIRLRRQGESYERILRLSQQLMAQASDTNLKGLLTRLCQEACAISGADSVVLYPLARDGVNFDTKTIAIAGAPLDPTYLDDHPPRHGGVTAYVLRQGTRAVNDVAQSTLEFDGVPLSKQNYITREGIAAFIGVPIRVATTARPLGVLYLDYRRPQAFSAPDVWQAEHLASVASTVIGNAYRVEQEAERYARESTRLQAIQEESLEVDVAVDADTAVDTIVSTVLQQAEAIFGRGVNMILMRRAYIQAESQEMAQEEDWYFRWNPTKSAIEKISPPEVVRRTISKAFEGRVTVVEANILAVPIQTMYRTRGCICIVGFSDDQSARLERLVRATASALDNVYRQLRLHETLNAVQQIVKPTKLEDTLTEVVQAARKASHSLECVTLWYRDPTSNKRMLVRKWGELNEASSASTIKTGDDQDSQPLVDYVMRRQEPVWAEDVHDEKVDELLRKSTYVARQRLASVAAFPLLIGDDCVGALFFNYRRRHRFTPGERKSFSIFTASAAASIHEAQLLERAEQAKNRLNAAFKVVDAVGTELNVDKVLVEVLTALRKHFDRRGASVQPYVMLYDDAGEALYLPALAMAFEPVDNPLYGDQLRLRRDDRGIVWRTAERALEKGDIYVEIIPNARSHPDFVPFNSRTQSLLSAGLASAGRLWGVLAVSSDDPQGFDEQDQLLLELAAKHTLIAVARAEQAAELRYREAVSSVTTWAAELAHDINREVYSIRSRVDWLQRSEKDLSEQGRAWIKEIDDVAVGLADAARSARSDQQMDMQTFNLDQTLYAAALDLVARRWPEVVIHADLGCTGIEVCSYRERLWRAVRHLVRNAAEAMSGSGTLTLRTRCAGAQVEIQIEDTGPGVREELRGTLLREPYTGKGGAGDHGYGLLIARHLTESLSGRIRLLPQEEGRGAVFSLVLPRAPISKPAVTGPSDRQE